MKLKKFDVAGLAMSTGVGIITGLIYFCGKVSGKCEAFTEIANELQKVAEEAAKTEK